MALSWRGRKNVNFRALPKEFSAEKKILLYGIFFSKKCSIWKEIIKNVFRGTNLFSARNGKMIAKPCCNPCFSASFPQKKHFFRTEFFLKKIFHTEENYQNFFPRNKSFCRSEKEFPAIWNDFPCSPAACAALRARAHEKLENGIIASATTARETPPQAKWHKSSNSK